MLKILVSKKNFINDSLNVVARHNKLTAFTAKLSNGFHSSHCNY